MNVAVVGCGYVGLVTAVGLASIGHYVVGIEHDHERRSRIAAGQVPFHEPGVPEALRQALDDGSLTISGELDDVRPADVVLLCVQTPPTAEGMIDLAAVREVSAALAALPLDDGTKGRVLVVRSTVVPGTTETVVAPCFFGAGHSHSETLAVASNPEFLREGTALQDFVHTDRVLIGCAEPWAAERLTRLYEPLQAPILITTPATAELTKYASNALLSTLVSFSNEIARLAESTPGVDAEDVFDALHHDRRLRPLLDGRPVPAEIVSYLRAGCGFGGSCLPKDVAALAAYGASVDEPTPLLDAVLTVNRSQPERLVQLAEAALGTLRHRTVAVFGLAFKAGTDDVRAAPGLAVVDELLARDADVTVHDPLVAHTALSTYVARGVRVASTPLDALEQAAAVFVTTNAAEYRDIGSWIEEDGPVVVDGRRVIDPGSVRSRYVGIGLAP